MMFPSCRLCESGYEDDSVDAESEDGEGPRPYSLELDGQQGVCLAGTPTATLLLHNGGNSRLTQRAFYIGSSEKRGTKVKGVVGRFGEGLNLSLAALWRGGCIPEIWSDGERWELLEHDGQLWIEPPVEDDPRFPIGAVQYAAHAMGVKEAVRELVSNWFDECTLQGAKGAAALEAMEPDYIEWGFGDIGSLMWTGMSDLEIPDEGVVFFLSGLPHDALDPNAFLRLVPPSASLRGTDSGAKSGGMVLLDSMHAGVVFIHGVRFDGLINRVRIDEDACFDSYATGSGVGYALEDPKVHVPRDRDAVAERHLLPHLAKILLSSSVVKDSHIQKLLYSLLSLYPNGLESRIVRWAMTKDSLASKLQKLGQATFAEFRRMHGPAAFAVDRPLHNMDLDDLRMSGLEAVDMSRAPTLVTLMCAYGGHPDLSAAIAAARANAERVAVDYELLPEVRRSVDAAAAEVGRSAGVVVHVRAVDGPPNLVRRHLQAFAGQWTATIHWTLLEPSSIHRRVGGCPAKNREGQCSCAFVATVREVLAGAKDAGVLNSEREQLLLWNMLALGASASSSPPDTSKPIRQVPPSNSQQSGGQTSAERNVQRQVPVRRPARTGGDEFRTTVAPGDVVVSSGSSADQPVPADRLCCMPAALLRRDSHFSGPVGVFLEDGPAAQSWAQANVLLIDELRGYLNAMVAACRLSGDGIHVFVGAAPSEVLAFNVNRTVFISARSFTALPRSAGASKADRIFAWLKHELAHNSVLSHDMAFIIELEEIGTCLDAEWFQSQQRAAIDRRRV